MPDPKSASRRLRTSVVWLALAASLLLLVKLSTQYRGLQTQFSELFTRLSSAQPGYRVPWVPTVTLDGDSVTLGQPQGHAQVLFFYTSICPHCRATVPAWNGVAGRAGDSDVFGVQLDSNHVAEQYRDSLGIQYPIVALDTALAIRVGDWFRVRAVPFTVVVGSDGRVAYSRRGRIEDPLVVDSIIRAARGGKPN